ncbi:cytochrome-c peroxidase [Aureibacter tunicatorum]|uniref:Cytochrome c peroxidase n=1 Tax=Aureibacter tunicatorum TaxID=866807 RepID=A0AAE3XPV2_9BACT|nr:cytochrome c peroxidase [Aureibacter tunicatorum]MDR6239849.1 cytochrome c peroxidase [Aureibacter tunicatorum]BDD04324.1 cytochrome-c peroxidase [Aureibacter tunicatorum]
MRRIMKFVIFSFIYLFGAGLDDSMAQKQAYNCEKVAELYRDDLSKFEKAVNDFHKSIDLMENTLLVKEKLKNMRLAYKRFEFLFSNIDPEMATKYFNGAPLPKLNSSDPSLYIIEPEGLQVLEELVYEDEINYSKTLKLAKKLQRKTEELMVYQSRKYITDHLVFDGVRLGLIRLNAFGITGFDSPSLEYSISESKETVVSISRAINIYLPTIAEKDPDLARRIRSSFIGLEATFENVFFDDYDRLSALKDYINPLYSDLLIAQKLLQIETIYETIPLHTSLPLNYNSINIFSENFLNKYHYAKLRESEDNNDQKKLGKMLFFDPALSGNNQRSCASCHNPSKGFSDGNKKSLAMDFNGTVPRNSPTLLNSIYSDRFFHDLRALKLEDQFEHVIFSDKEFDTSYKEIVSKLNESKEYKELFAETFDMPKDEAVSSSTIQQAIASYVVSLSSLNSDFDKFIRGERDQISESVKLGYNIFTGKGKCATCHFAPIFNGLVPPYFKENESEILGVPVAIDNPEIDPDLGRAMGVLKERTEIYEHSFKTPTVRNAELTGPYMHNGVYSTLEEVVDFYNNGGGVGMGMDLPRQTLPSDSLHLSEIEQEALVDFIKSLTDTVGMNAVPSYLPKFENSPELNARTIGGDY